MTRLFFLVVIALATSCNLYRDVELLEVQDVQFNKFDTEGVEAQVLLQLDNPNWYNVVLTESHVELFLNGRSLGVLQLQEKMVIPKKCVSLQTMKVEAGYDDVQNILSNLLAFIFRSEFLIEGKGYVKGRAFFVAHKVPVEFKETVKKSDMGF